MIQYRICPYSYDQWKVQQRRRFVWRNVRYHSELFMFSYVRSFDTEAEAEGWIDERLNDRRLREQQDAETARRLRDIPPRGYP